MDDLCTLEESGAAASIDAGAAPQVSEEDPKLPVGLPARLGPLMGAHFLVTLDRAQRRQWLERIEAIEQAQWVAEAVDPLEKQLLAQPAAYRQIKEAGVVGSLYGLGIASLWMGWLIPLYAFGHGFGWWAAAFLLPAPFAFGAARRSWQRAALSTMRQRLRRRGNAGALRRSFAAGFGFGFLLVFLQALLTWFMTPAPTFGQELLIDAWHATLGGLLSGTLSTVLAPVIGRLPGRNSGALVPRDET